MYLLDTNIFRHLDDEVAHPKVRKWLRTLSDRDLFVSVISLRESRKGVERLRQRKADIAAQISAVLDELVASMSDRILPIDSAVAQEWGRMLATREKHIDDAGIAATAKTHGLTLVTRNVTDFRGRGVPLLNPYKDPPERL